ncbi:hypothetical protein [Candidatus Carsonella ruddii]|uniref:Uncharacterized protein n=1 Tax=Candidatus Carsonella ruddii (Diaphorina cf. continua) TaxID=2661587 RepID=A0A7R6VYJ1_CARRU|nr:hypothetical protein [Candidatus Carsonella ruddii (Diaphorina cf. continua)]BCG49334.1 hypothetical protein CRDco_1110 [Candidatus Carsonella ruddii (Diaphorina cf. continua)]
MIINFLIYSQYRVLIKIKFKIKIVKTILIIIKKKKINFYNFKKIIFFDSLNNKNDIVFYLHNCKKNVFHSIKHFLKINHNSILENKINEIF